VQPVWLSVELGYIENRRKFGNDLPFGAAAGAMKYIKAKKNNLYGYSKKPLKHALPQQP
jgi:hypothetical protein